MSTATKIEWTRGDDGTAGATWNPVTGCTEVSEGCDHCYARTFAERWRGVPGHPFEQGFDLKLWPERLALPLKWRKPKRIFVNSMSDLFHADVPDEFIAHVFAVMAATPRHTYQVLTKRHGRIRSLIQEDPQNLLEHLTDEAEATALYDAPWPLPNVWMGVSVESQKWADIRIPALLETPAVIRWLSCEPLLGPVDIRRWLHESTCALLTEDVCTCSEPREVRPDWVVVGGESGHGARPVHPDWARSLRDHCAAAGVPFFFKQWGAWAPAGRGIGMAQHNIGREMLVGQPLDDMGHRQVMRRVGKGKSGNELDGRTWDEYPEQRVIA